MLVCSEHSLLICLPLGWIRQCAVGKIVVLVTAGKLGFALTAALATGGVTDDFDLDGPMANDDA